MLCNWNEGSPDAREKLIDECESNPVETSEYAVVKCLVEEPAIKWWLRFTPLQAELNYIEVEE